MTVAELLATSPSGAPDRRQAFEAAAKQAADDAFGMNLRADLAEDLPAFHGYINGWSVPRHQLDMCEALAQVEETPDARLIITEPPRHGKTETEVSALTWMLGRGHTGAGPIRRAGLAMYGETMARGYTAQARNHFLPGGKATDVFRCRIGAMPEAAWAFDGVPAGRPSCIAVGVGGPLTGRGVDLLLVDDPIKTADEARSDVYRERVWRWWQQVARTRLQPGARVVVTMTRWHEDDLVGRLIAQGGGWRVLHMPAIDDDGNALWPEQYSVSALDAIRVDIGPAAFEALYQGRPTPSDGDVWRRDWFEQAYHTGPQPPFELVWTAWDTAFKVGEGNDYTAGVRMGRTADGHLHVLGVRRRRMPFPELLAEIELGLGGDPSEPAVIEDKASGQSAIQTLRQQSRRPVVAVKADTDKEARARAVSHLAQAGWVHLNPQDSGSQIILSELLAFPNGTHDDVHDAFVHGLAWGSLHPRQVLTWV